MMIVENTEPYCEYFTSGDDEGREVLFELFDHSVDEHLSESVEDTHSEHVYDEHVMICEKFEDVTNLQ